MNKVLLAGVAATGLAACAADDAAAMDIGWGLALNNEVTTEYNIDAEHLDVTWAPEVSYELPFMSGLSTSAGMDIPVYNTTDEFAIADVLEEGSRPDLNLKTTYAIGDNLETYVKTGWDLNASELNDIVVGATFSF